MRRIALATFVIAFVIIILRAERACSIPAFARKYDTSCQTCHIAYPKLNAFGDAFRRDGYQFPAGMDAEFVKEKPVPLGAEASKRAFPDVVWPGTIPGSSPVSLFFNGEMDYNPHGPVRSSFADLGNSIEVAAAATLGEDLACWGQGALNSDGSAELERVFLSFTNIIGDSYALNARLGVIEPRLFSFSTHRSLLEGYWITERPFSDDMGWTIEETQKGIEINGMARGRLEYDAGLVESFGLPQSRKDFYGHLTYKFGGMRLDGITSGAGSSGPSQPYIDNSITFGAFGYSGGALIGTANSSQENDFTMFGGDVNAFWDRYNLYGGVGFRHDKHPFLESPNCSANTVTWFSELDAVVYPWLVPAVRFEYWHSHQLAGNDQLQGYTDYQFVPGIVALLRANVKGTLRTSVARLESEGSTRFELGQVMFLISIGV
jgi:hypothetical protein